MKYFILLCPLNNLLSILISIYLCFILICVSDYAMPFGLVGFGSWWAFVPGFSLDSLVGCKVQGSILINEFMPVQKKKISIYINVYGSRFLACNFLFPIAFH